MKRRDFLFQASTAVAASLVGCGGGSAESTAAAAGPGSPSPGAPNAPSNPPSAPPSTTPPPPPLSTGLSVLTLHSSQTGTLPYLSSIYPLEGAVPNGQTVASPDDPSLRGTVISRWPDGSASVIVIAGEASVAAGAAKQLTLRNAEQAGAPLTAARVGQLLNDISVNVGGAAVSLTAFAAPERTWWANERVVCCRYRLAIGVGALEAVIDVHAFSSDRAFVEVVLENSKFNANAGFQSAPGAQAYGSASVSVNGAAFATASSTSAPTGTHQGFRAWYASTWVGGDPGLEVTHDPESLQAHPLMPRLDQASNQSLQNVYQNDAYSAWSTGRNRATGMGGGGDHPSIGYLPQWDMRYVQSGNRFARRAVLASALAVLSYNVNYRDSNSGRVPTFAQSSGYQRAGGGGWPDVTDGGDRAIWQISHHPAAGLIAFLCRPSPVFIEIAQKIAHLNGTWSNGIGADGVRDGTFGKWYQVRGQAWGTRSLAHAIFLTPDGDAWKQPARDALYRNAQGFLRYRDDQKNRLDTMWSGDYNAAWDDQPGISAHQAATFMAFYFTTAMHHAANAKLLTGTQQTAMAAVADWTARFPVRWVNETPGGVFRHIPQRWTIGASGTTSGFVSSTMSQFSDWGAMASSTLGADAPPLAGPWRVYSDTPTSYSQFSNDNVAGAYYPSYFWAALVCAVERDVAGAAAAWTKVTSNVTNLSSWRTGFAAEPRWGYYPRNR